jgi:hydrogenase 3 maturation protease
MMGDDGAGPLLAEMCAANPVGEWVVIDGGSAPENDIVAIRELRPERLLIVDATDMGLNPGEIRIVDPDDIAEMFMMTTHNMPLNYLIDQLKEDVGEVIFLGIQPDIVGFYYPMTQPIKDAVEVCTRGLMAGRGGRFCGTWKPQRSWRSRLRSASRGKVAAFVGRAPSPRGTLRQIFPVAGNHLLIPPERLFALTRQRAVPASSRST